MDYSDRFLCLGPRDTWRTQDHLSVSLFKLAVADSGAAVACVIDFINNDIATMKWGVRAYYRPSATATWSGPVVIGDDAVDNATLPTCKPVVSKNGAAAVVATRVLSEEEPAVSQIIAMVRPAGEGWQEPFVVSGADRQSWGPSAVFDAAGNLTVAWRERWRNIDNNIAADDRGTVKLRHWTASNRVWGTTIDPPGAEGDVDRNLFLPTLAGNDSGRVILAWTEGASLNVSERPTSAAAFSAPSPVLTANPGETVTPQTAGVSPNGTFYIGYYHASVDPTVSRAAIARKVPGGDWTMKEIGPQGGIGSIHTICFLGDDAIALLRMNVNGTAHLQAIRWRAGAAQPDGERDLITPAPASIEMAHMVPDGQGGLLTFYDVGAPTNAHMLIPFDGSAPRAVSVDVPAKAVAGKKVTLKASFGDRWSALAGVKWSFGDGRAADGAAVQHAWAKPGVYTVRVEGRDTLGNARTVEKKLAVAGSVPKLTLITPKCGARKGKSCRAFRKSRAAWKVLHFRATSPTGIKNVRVTVSRKAGKRFDVLKGKRFLPGKTAKQARRIFVVALRKGANWQLRLPRQLMPGRYTIRAVATDMTGNKSRPLVRTLTLR